MQFLNYLAIKIVNQHTNHFSTFVHVTLFYEPFLMHYVFGLYLLDSFMHVAVRYIDSNTYQHTEPLIPTL